ncbi:uncharacterized protein LOC129732123 isoform X2 [Wyeomyia smithii]|uniref:uncharacterized protein LOC129732123 isoform X2 n=1 Tax=Wyeomyia smithii TaxID=174621 RepID=UPI002467B771|nr:uncharacterized protein LOC129732123 isoform X2 [Wyeomyia smithii]
MVTTADLTEWMELLNDMLQFLDATTASAVVAHPQPPPDAPGFEDVQVINGNQQQHEPEKHPQSGAELKCEEECDSSLENDKRLPPGAEDDGPRENAEYMNIVNESDESRYMLMYKCKSFLWKLEQLRLEFTTASKQERKDEPEEDENSYLEMCGVGHKNDINLTQPTDRIDSGCENFDSNVHEHVLGSDNVAKLGPEEASNSDIIEEQLNEEENCYDFTTDSCLYDDCSELKLNNAGNVVFPVEDNSSGSNSSKSCPFSGLPAAHLRIKQSPKHGTLFRLEKRLFFDQSKKFYVGLLDRWLLLYNSCNELKPAQCIQIKDIKLDLSLNDQINEKNQFHIITPDDAKLCFLTPSFKELNEWVVAIQQNLLIKSDSQPGARKLPLPPTPEFGTGDETDSGSDQKDHDDGIYEEPQQILHSKRNSSGTRNEHNYDTPKATAEVGHNLNQQHAKASPTKIINVSSPTISPSSGKANKCEPICQPPVPTVANVSGTPTNGSTTPAVTTPTTTTTPVKSWLFNRFNKSPDAGFDQKQLVRKPPTPKKLTLQGTDNSPASSSSLADVTAKPSLTSPIKMPSVTVPSAAAHKGSKINMIISQLEANGQLSLLSKSWNESPGKRRTWCAAEE